MGEALHGTPGESGGGVVLFASLLFLFDSLAIRLFNRQDTISLGFLPTLASITLFNPLAAALANGVGLAAVEIVQRKPFVKLIFNCSQWVIATIAAGHTYAIAGGVIGAPDGRSTFWPFLAGGVMFQVLNFSSVVLAISTAEGSPFIRTWMKLVRWIWPNYFALLPLALVLAIAYQRMGAPGVAFFCLPLLVARYAFKLHEDLRRTFHGTIRALAAALDAKDPCTAGHSQRVGELAALIGREMGLPEAQVEHLQIAGILHDVGKIGIPDAVLLKPGRFTPEEYDVMKQHAVLSGRILADVEKLEDVARWIACHHERWDGKGYPDGIAGEEIPLGARILAAADACDAMLSRRSYKDRYSWEHARSEMEVCAGRDFDPQVVAALLRIAGNPEVQAVMRAAHENGGQEAAPAGGEGGR